MRRIVVFLMVFMAVGWVGGIVPARRRNLISRTFSRWWLAGCALFTLLVSTLRVYEETVDVGTCVVAIGAMYFMSMLSLAMMPSADEAT